MIGNLSAFVPSNKSVYFCLYMRSLKTALAVVMSSWISVVACLLGCATPAFADTDPSNFSSTQASLKGHKFDPMMDMENCPHHPGKSTPRDGKSAPGRMSCCTPDATLTTKAKLRLPGAVLAPSFLPSPDLHLATIQFLTARISAPPIAESGRDTLLQTQLLRI